MDCKNEVLGGCTVYSEEGQKLRERLGYCPVADKYFDPDKQEAYEKSKNPKGRGRVGQQKQRKR
jgi:hypothetical protein